MADLANLPDYPDWYQYRHENILRYQGAEQGPLITNSDMLGGFVIDFSMNMSSEAFIHSIHTMLGDEKVPYLDLSTKTIFINFNCYEPSLDMFLYVQMEISQELAG